MDSLPTVTVDVSPIISSGTATAGESYSLECSYFYCDWVNWSVNDNLADGYYGKHDYIWNSDNW